MRRSALAGSVLASLVVVGLAGPASAFARPSTDPLPGVRVDAPASVQAEERSRAFMVELDGDPAAAVTTAARRRGIDRTRAGRAGREQRTDNRRQQTRVMRAARSQRLIRHELFRVTTAYNGVAVHATAADARRIARLPGVRAVMPLPEHQRQNARSVPTIGAPAVWFPGPDRPVGLTGHGVRIGVIDSGIDYVHRTFGGPGSYEDYEEATGPAHNPPVVGTQPPTGFKVEVGGTQLYPSARVVGGFDFAGDDYGSGEPGSDVPKPDANPLDCISNGHGTHVAGTIGGGGMLRDGSAFPWSPVWPSLESIDVGPGVAPEAELYALRVFGCDGGTSLTVKAIEWAIDPNDDGDTSDHLDVINLSLGSSFGSPDDPTSSAVQRAVDAGVAVAVSAGNDGNQTYQVGSPGTAPGALTVANMVTGRWISNRFPDFDTTDADTVAPSSSRGPGGGGALKPEIAAPGTSIRSARAGSGLPAAAIMSGTSMAAPHVAGALAIIRQQRPTWSVEEIKAALVNTADATVYVQRNHVGRQEAPQRVGTGMVRVDRATTTDVVAFSADGQAAVGVEFGSQQVPSTGLQADKQIAVVNKGTSEARFRLSVDERTAVPGATWQLPDGGQITVPAGARRELRLRLRVSDPAQLRNARDLTKPLATQPDGRTFNRWLAEASAVVVLTDATTDRRPSLAVPVHASLRPIAAAETGIDELAVLPSEAADGRLRFSGGSFDTGTSSDQFLARRTMLEHQATSPRLPVVPNQPERPSLDLREVGVGASDDWITFGVQTWGRRAAPTDFGSVEVVIDTDLDGWADYAIVAGRVLLAPFEELTDIFVTCVYVAATPDKQPSCWPAPLMQRAAEGGIFDTDVQTLSVPRAAVGLDGASTRFRYLVSSWERRGVEPVDQVGPLTWDPQRPGVAFRTDDAVPDGSGTERVTFDPAAAADYGTLGALVLHHLGAAGSTAERIALRSQGADELQLTGPTVVDEGTPATWSAVRAAVPGGGPIAYAWDAGPGSTGSAVGGSAQLTFDDGPAAQSVRVQATVDRRVVGRQAPVTVRNVPPSVSLHLVGERTVRVAATDPSAADQAAGFDLRVTIPGHDAVTGRGTSLDVPLPTSSVPLTVSATATDKDGGVSTPVAIIVPASPPLLPPADPYVPPPPPYVPPVVPVAPVTPVVPAKRTTIKRASTKRCRVPQLKNRTLASAKKRLKKAHCRLGKAHRPKPWAKASRKAKRRMTLVVSRQSIKRNAVRKVGTKVNVQLRVRPRR